MNTVKIYFKKIMALILGLIFAIVIVEISLRAIGYIQNAELDKNQISKDTKYRILSLGNSYTAGIGAPPGKSYSNQLNEMLNEVKSNYYQVINTGKGAANSSYIRENTGEWLKKYSPQIVFIMIGEPNSWNKYGYWEFITKRNGESPIFVSTFTEKLRWLKIFKLFELFTSRAETWNETAYTGYSNTFKSTPLNKSSAKMVGYLWLGNLFQYVGYNISQLSNAQVEEAIKSLSYIYKEDKSLEAGEILSELLLYRKGKIDEALGILENIVDSRDVFNFGPYRILTNSVMSLTKAQDQYKNLIIEKLRQKKNADKIEMIVSWHYSAKNLDLVKNKKNADELIDIFLSAYPASIETAKVIVERNMFSNPDKAMDAIEATNLLNPMAPINNLLDLASFIVTKKPEQKNRMDTILDKTTKKIDAFDFKKMKSRGELEEEWIISDLEQIITMVQKSGAHPVVQSYPPLKSGEERFADVVLRKWWKNRKDKSNIQFMDVNADLKELFSLQKGGEKYYTKMFGPMDDHQNAEGYKEIAQLMFPYVMSKSN